MNAQTKVLPTPVDWDELYPGRFLKAADLKGKNVTLTIAAVRIEELVGDKGPQIKGVISFERTEKQWALNKTNGICLKEMFGKKVQEWVGRRVTLFSSQWDGEDCLRVYGSPDIPDNRELTIALPRKRPFKMTMHRTAGGAAPANAGAAPAAAANGSSGPASAGPPAVEEALRALRAAQTLDALAKSRKSVWALYAAAKQDVPLDVEAAANEHRESLEEQM